MKKIIGVLALFVLISPAFGQKSAEKGVQDFVENFLITMLAIASQPVE